jgi:ABC-2 type transport system ATP-binding protein
MKDSLGRDTMLNNTNTATAEPKTNPFFFTAPETKDVNSTVIELKNLEVSYGKFKAVQGISLQVREGEVFGILGPNGAGKTTTLSVIEGLRKPSGGTATVLGYDVVKQSVQIRREIGLALQSTSFFEGLSLIELVKVYAAMYNSFPSKREIEDMLARFDLSEKSKVQARQLSGGQAQRLALLLSVVNNPKIVFLDEPTTALDPQARRNIWEVIKQLRAEGRTIVLTTHYMEEAQELCHRLAIIDHGQVIAHGSPGQLINQLGADSRVILTAKLPIEKVRALPGVRSAEYEGERLTAYLSSSQEGLLAIQQLALASGQVLTDMSVKQPDLEEVFIALTGRSLRS